jgi:hypothetical protein
MLESLPRALKQMMDFKNRGSDKETDQELLPISLNAARAYFLY